MILSAMAPGRGLDRDPPRSLSSGTRQDGSAARAERRDHGRPVGKDDRKRGVRGFDGHKRVKGRKRHLLVDTLGLPIAGRVEPAGMSDRRAGARLVAGLSPRRRSGERLISACLLPFFKFMPTWFAIFSVSNQLSRNRPGEPSAPLPHHGPLAKEGRGDPDRIEAHHAAGWIDLFEICQLRHYASRPQRSSQRRRIDLNSCRPAGAALFDERPRMRELGRRTGEAATAANCRYRDRRAQYIACTFQVRKRAVPHSRTRPQIGRRGCGRGMSIRAQPSSTIGASSPTVHPPRFAARHR